MASSPERTTANQKNSLRSTGPRTPAGKAVVARNALRHGILSARFLLDGEDEADLQCLFDGLCESLQPLGALEVSLVEKVALNLWRHRRLVRAEGAEIKLHRKDADIAEQATAQLGLPWAGRITEDDLNGVDTGEINWCRAVIEEYEELPEPLGRYPWRDLEKHAPQIHAQITSDAADEGQSVEGSLAGYGEGLREYLEDLVGYARGQIRKSEQAPVVAAIAELIRAQRAIPRAAVRETLARYQTMLDNELYRALRALREAQEWRLQTIPGVVTEDAAPALEVA